MHRLLRPLLLATTALLSPALAEAQAPTARPQGGAVVAGQARIAQTPTRTQVNQTSSRAVIEWRGFDIGANHQVDIRQPASSSWSLQRVTGPDPSAIAGRLTSNGGVAIVNPAGIVFQGGAQVDVAGLIATTADTTNESFMAGRMAFDGAPRPGARVENRGSITVRGQGLAALVGPVAANSGTIRARLGRVAVAGGEAFALDMAGDGLLSLDVTRQVRAAPSGSTALATNTGTIEAEGGHVLLTARAASGVLETLVEAGGTIRAASITANAPGGGLRVPNGALLDASAPTGGGRITVGAGATSQVGAPVALSARTTVERGATLDASATTRGDGGRVIVHAAERTAMSGRITARGGPQGGRGGRIEVSSRRSLMVDGTLQAGPDGRVLIDPEELHIVETPSGATEPEEIAASTVNTTDGHLILQADRRIRVLAEVNRDAGPLTLETTNATALPGEGISIEAPLAVLGDLRLRSAGDITQLDDGARIGATTLFAESRGGNVRLESFGNAILALDGGFAAGRFDIVSANRFSVDAPVEAGALRLTSLEGIALFSPVSVTGTAELVSLGVDGITQAASGAGIAAGTLALESPFAAIRLDGAGNRIAALGDISAPAGLALRNTQGLRLDGTLNGLDAAVSLTLDSGDLTQGAGSRLLADFLTVATPGGSVLLDAPNNLVSRLAGSARDVLALDAGRALLLDGTGVSAAEIRLTAQGDLSQVTDALVVTPLLRARATGGSVRLDDPLNEIAVLGDSGADGVFSLATRGSLTLAGRLAAPEVALVAGGGLVQAPGGTVEAGLLSAVSLTDAVALDGTGNRVAALGSSSGTRGFGLVTDGALEVAGFVQGGLGTLRLEADSLRLRAPLAAMHGTLLARTGSIAQESGTLAIRALRAEAAIDVRLDAAGNDLAFVGGRAGGVFRVAGTGALSPIDLAALEVVLLAGGNIFQAELGLGVATDLLTLAAGGRAELTSRNNAIRGLGTADAPDGLLLRTATALDLAGPVTTAVAVLDIGGDLTQRSGAGLSAGTLRLLVTGSATLEDAGNDLPRLLGAEVAGGLSLTTSGSLALDGFVQAGGTVNLIALSDLSQVGGHVEAPVLIARSVFAGVSLDGLNRIGAAGGGAAATWRLRSAGTDPVRIAGLVAAPEVLLTLAGGLEQGSGALRADVLGLDVAGVAMLDGPDHRVAALSGRAGELWLAAGGPLDVTGALDVGGQLGLSADRIGLAAPVSAGGAATLVALGGDIAQAATGAGLTLAGGLQVHAAGAVALGGAGNQVARLSAGTAAGDFVLANQGALLVGGAIAGETVTLRATGTLTLDGAAFQAGRAVLLASPAGIAGGAQSTLDPLDPARLPVLIMDTRRAAGLAAIPDAVLPDLPGLPAASQPTQLAQFGTATIAAAGGAAFDVVAGASPVFLLLNGGPSVGTLEAARLGVLGQGSSAFLVGVLGGVGGEAAATLVNVSGSDSGYRFNDCAMGSAACGATAPPTNPPVMPPTDPVLPGVPPEGPGLLPPVGGPGLLPPLGGPLVPFRVGLASLDAPGAELPPAEEEARDGWAPWPLAWPLPPLVAEE